MIYHWLIFKIRNISYIVIEKVKTHFIFNIFFRKFCILWENVEKYNKAKWVTDDNIIRRMRLACWITKYTDDSIRRRMRFSCWITKYTDDSIRPRMRFSCWITKYTDDSIIRRMRLACWITKATKTCLQYFTIIAFPQQQCLSESYSEPYYTYVASLVNKCGNRFKPLI
jgi:hypothetical protein